MSMPLPRTEFVPPGLPGRAEVNTPWSVRHAGLTALLVLAISGDFANFYITLSVVANEYPTITVLVVLALSASAVALAHAVGVQLRGDQHRPGGRRPASRRAMVVATGCWMFLGLTAAVVRWFAPPTGGSIAAVAQFGSQAGSALPPEMVQRLTSLLLLGLYLASGVLAAWIAYLNHDPAMTVRRSAWRRMAWTGYRNRRCQAALARAETVLRGHLDSRDGLADAHAAAWAEREALAAELKAYTRILIAQSLRDPAATETLTFISPATDR